MDSFTIQTQALSVLFFHKTFKWNNTQTPNWTFESSKDWHGSYVQCNTWRNATVIRLFVCFEWFTHWSRFSLLVMRYWTEVCTQSIFQSILTQFQSNHTYHSSRKCHHDRMRERMQRKGLQSYRNLQRRTKWKCWRTDPKVSKLRTPQSSTFLQIPRFDSNDLRLGNRLWQRLRRFPLCLLLVWFSSPLSLWCCWVPSQVNSLTTRPSLLF